jgi:hypothetical protein
MECEKQGQAQTVLRAFPKPDITASIFSLTGHFSATATKISLISPLFSTQET